MNKERASYNQEFRIKAVELSISRGETLSVSRELNINRDTLRKWKTAYDEGKLGTGVPGARKHSPEQEEITRLRKALHESNLERDILKKAVAIFSTKDR
jgi:transposase